MATMEVVGVPRSTLAFFITSLLLWISCTHGLEETVVVLPNDRMFLCPPTHTHTHTHTRALKYITGRSLIQADHNTKYS
jgi:hypothetical protein